LFEAWPEIIGRLRSAGSRALLLDFDGTLARLQPRPADVLLAERTKKILRRLAMDKTFFVAVVSGRHLRTLQTVIGVEGIHYIGLHGAERKGKSTVLGKTTQRDLLRAKRDALSKIHALPGVWIEDKGLSFAVHYRGARPASVQAADLILREILAPMRNALRVLHGDRVWEVVPREVPGKGVAVRELMKGLPDTTVAMYFGDDETDEEVFAVLPGQITVRVGRGRSTRADFYVRSPGEVLRFLFLLERSCHESKRAVSVRNRVLPDTHRESRGMQSGGNAKGA
jgi:trehalose-phosphatase